MDTKKLIIAGMILVIAFAGMTISRKFMDEEKAANENKSTEQTVLNETWEMHRIGETGLALLTPETLKMIPTKLDNKAKETLKSYKSFEFVHNSFGLRINHIVARNELNAKIYAEQLTKMFEMSSNFLGYKYEITPFEANGRAGTFVKGSAVQKGVNLEMGSAVFTIDEKLWEVTIQVDSESEKLKELAEKVFQSIQIQ